MNWLYNSHIYLPPIGVALMKNIFIFITMITLLGIQVAFADTADIILYKSSCQDYFLAEGTSGYYLLEWYGGYIPSVGDSIEGNISNYGMHEVLYPLINQEGKVYVDEYMLSKESALEKYLGKCN
jgi:hypothetical protein